MKISKKAVDYPFFVILCGIVVVFGGTVAIRHLPIEEVPDIVIPFTMVFVPYPGAAPEEVETEVTRDLDDRLATVNNIDWISSVAMENGSVHFMKFYDGTDMRKSLFDVKDEVDVAKTEFPEEAEEPLVKEISFNDTPIILLPITGRENLFELKDIAEDLRSPIRNIPGVEQVEVFGGYEREVQVKVHPHKTKEYGLSLIQVSDALKSQNMNLPAGDVAINKSEYLVRTMGRFERVEDILRTVIPLRNGSSILLKDIAKIEDTHKKVESYSRFNGKDSVTLIVRPRSGLNTIKTIELIREEVGRLEAKLPSGVEIHTFSDRGKLIKRGTNQLLQTALFGLALVVFILYGAMGLRNALLVSSAIPVSLLVAMIGLYVFGMEISQVALFSLILAIGMVVDGAIIVGESIFSEIEKGLGPIDAAKEGIDRVGVPVISADLTTVSAFVPMIFVVGIMGQFMSVIPKVVSFALCGSILADHFLLPVLASKYMRIRRSRTRDAANRLFFFFRSVYVRFLRGALRHRVITIAASLAALVAALSLLASGRIGTQFFPIVDVGRFYINFSLASGTPLARTNEIGLDLERHVARIPEVEGYVLTTGNTGALSSDMREGGSSGPEYGRITVELVHRKQRDRSQDEIIQSLRRSIGVRPGVEIDIRELREGPPGGAPVAIRMRGGRTSDLVEVSKIIERRLRAIPGTLDIRSDYRTGRPELQVRVDREKAMAAYGVTSAAVARTLSIAYLGEENSEIILNEETVDIRLMITDGRPVEINAVRELTVPSRDGVPVTLGQISDIRLTTGMRNIIRYNQKRAITIRSEHEPWTTADEVRRQLREAMAAERLPAGITLEYSGDNEDRDRSFASLWSALKWGLLLILFILTAQFNSYKQPIIVMLAIPLSLVGVFFGLWATGNHFGFPAFVGIVALAGIVVNDSIVLVDHVNRSRRAGSPVREAIVAGAEARFRPVLMTTVTTTAGLLPLTLGFAGAGELWAPLGWSIIFGLAAATALTLVVIPVIYSYVEGMKRAERLEKTFERT